VYSRVLELSPGHERATFALGALTPLEIASSIAAQSAGSARTSLTPTGDEAFAEWEPPAHVLGSFISAKSGEQEATPSTAAPSAADHQDAGLEFSSAVPVENASARDESADVDQDAATPVAGIYAQPEEDSAIARALSNDSADEPAAEQPESALDTTSLKRDLQRARTSGSVRTVEQEQQREGAEDFVDLGDWLRDTEPSRTTRMVVEDAPPSGNEEADFADMLRRFKRGVAENVDEEDFASHYDLGVAYKEMGLVDEAIAQFQRSLRGESHRIRSYEALGQCFVEKSQFPVAIALLQRAADTSDVEDHRLVGVLYLLGYSMEASGRRTDAMRYYQRVFAVDIDFRDVAQRIAAMEHSTT
jgi:tetratricopeptide (TPR) repeat protein